MAQNLDRSPGWAFSMQTQPTAELHSKLRLPAASLHQKGVGGDQALAYGVDRQQCALQGVDTEQGLDSLIAEDYNRPNRASFYLDLGLANLALYCAPVGQTKSGGFGNGNAQAPQHAGRHHGERCSGVDERLQRLEPRPFRVSNSNRVTEQAHALILC